MQILDNLIIISLIILSFIAGMKLSESYHRKALLDKKDALERQFLRLQAKADADDPCKPYKFFPRSGDFDGDWPIKQAFIDELKANGKAKTSFRKSDITK